MAVGVCSAPSMLMNRPHNSPVGRALGTWKAFPRETTFVSDRAGPRPVPRHMWDPRCLQGSSVHLLIALVEPSLPFQKQLPWDVTAVGWPHEPQYHAHRGRGLQES